MGRTVQGLYNGNVPIKIYCFYSLWLLLDKKTGAEDPHRKARKYRSGLSLIEQEYGVPWHEIEKEHLPLCNI